jgi:hypothetical protein
MYLVAQARGNRGLAIRQGLRDLRSRLPEYEQKLIALHLDLGVSDASAIANRIASELRQHVPAAAKSVSATLRGSEATGARREAMLFDADVGVYAAGVAGRVLVAVERQRRQKPVVVKATDNGKPPRSRICTLDELLGHGEQSWLDWKRQFPPGIAGGHKHADREEHRGKLLKSLVSIANSIVDECGYLVYGVEDKGNRRTVIGVETHFDDATFQDWNEKGFAPPVHFHYREEQHEGRRVALFEIAPSSNHPHVCARDIGGELHTGQVWFRRGSRNTLASHVDLKRMFAPPEPLRSDQFDGAPGHHGDR